MKISWFFLLVLFAFSWLDEKTSNGSSIPSPSKGSVPVTEPSITDSSSVSIKGSSTPSVNDGSVSVEGGSTQTASSGYVALDVGEASSKQFSLVSSSSTPLSGGIDIDLLFDSFDDSGAIDSFTGRPVSEDVQQAVQQSLVAGVDMDAPTGPPMVGFTLLRGAAGKGAFCLDGSLPGYHFDNGFGPGETSWLVNLEGGGWCSDLKSCVFRKNSRHGSSDRMQKSILFTGILSNNPNENPDFFNWNRVRVRYCDGASFRGEGENMDPHLFFRGQRIWWAAMDELMALGMSNATQVLLSGCSAGGLSTIHHCDEFREMFPVETKVKCLSDAGFFVDAESVAGKRTLRTLYNGTVTLQGVGNNLPQSCTSVMEDPSLCFFPQYIIDAIKTPLFLVNTAYDAWQIQDSLAPKSSDHNRHWLSCILNIANCNETQLEFLHGFRLETLDDLFVFSTNIKNGLFINSCFAHCQTDKPTMWHGNGAPRVKNKTIADAVGDWYFDRTSPVKLIDCPYPCNPTCHNLVFERTISV